MASNQEGRQINTVSKSQKIPHSHFTLNKRFGLTTCFGKNYPVYAREFVNDDGPVTIEPNCDIRSYTLKAPMIGTIKKHVSAYQVPIQAALPFNWEKIVKNPTRGTDVVGDSSQVGLVKCLDGVNTVVSDFSHRVITYLERDFTNLIGEEPSFPTQISAVPQFVDYWLWFILKYENFLSEGSLISLLGAHFGAPVRFHGPDLESSEPTFFSFDQFCEIILLGLSNYELSVRSSDGSALVAGYGVRHIRKILDFMRQHKGHFTFTCSRVVNSSFPVNPDDYSFGDLYSPELQSEPYNYFRCIAYQLINAHYFTNDKIDYINTAELYRQFISSLIKDHDSLDYTFTFNGVSTQYDYLSGFYVNIYLNHYLESDFGDSDYDSTFYPLISAIFGYNYSLRYMDYFVGARPRNLAVGDTSVRVQNNTVQVVDVTKNIVKQRFLNAVGRIGNTIEEYSDKILGRRLEYDYHNPKYLFSFDADVFTSEVENTADAQQENLIRLRLLCVVLLRIINLLSLLIGILVLCLLSILISLVFIILLRNV